jgi:hypothetical protein
MKRCFKVSKGHANSFLLPEHLKKRVGRSRLKGVSSGRMGLRNNNLPLNVLKNDFGEIDETIFKGVERICEIIFCILDIEQSDMDESLM